MTLQLGVAHARVREQHKEIARRLGVSERTAWAYLTSIYNKLGVDSRASAVAIAMQRGLLPPQG